MKHSFAFYLRIVIISAVAGAIIFMSTGYRFKSESDLSWVPIQGGSFRQGITIEQLQQNLKELPKHSELRKYLLREAPQVEKTVTGFSIMKTEVTVAQYHRCIQKGICRKPKEEDRCTYYRPDPSNYPMNCVDWNDAKHFCEWIGGRLPTESEWEYAARSEGKNNMYPWGNNPKPSCDLAIIDQDGRGCGRRSLWPVCSVPKGNTEQGLCDMSGNAWEWTADISTPYPGFKDLPADIVDRNESELFKSDEYVVRGGGISSVKDYRTTLRGAHKSDFVYGGLSFRCVR